MAKIQVVRIFKYTNKKKSVFIGFLLLIFVLSFFSFHKNKIIIWSWERNEDLTFLNRNVFVSYYAGSVILKNGRMSISERTQPLKLNSDTKVIPVVRIDNFDNAEDLTAQRIQSIGDFIIEMCNREQVVGCQIDFDAKTSEKPAYTSLISLVRDKLPKNIPLSITALVSWCDKYSWINDTKIDFAIPMFYRLGPDKNSIRNGYTGQTFMKSSKCANSIGISTDEPLPMRKYIGNRDIYVFNPNSWNEEGFERIIRAI